LLVCFAALLVSAATLLAQAKPISRQGLVEALKIGGLTPQELVQLVQQRGVSFKLTPDAETELRNAGAAQALIEAVRAGFRAPAAPAAPKVGGPPLTKNEIMTLLSVGPPPARVEELVTQRGVSFTLTPEITRELEGAGASRSLIERIVAHQSAAAPPLPPPAQTPAAPAAPRVAPSGPVITSLRQVHKLYIDKMPNDLDSYIRAELSKRLASRITVVLKPEEADAIMIGTSEAKSGVGAAVTGRGLGLHDTATGAVSIKDRSGERLIWATEAGDRSLVFGALKRGGPRKVAERIVENLKKALQQM
jgi:hypothetical protein